MLKSYYQNNKATIYSILKIAFPLMIGGFFQMFYNLTDSFFLGKLGREHVSAPLIAFHLIFFLFVFGFSFSMAGTTLISQSKGKNDQQKIDLYLGQMTFLLLIVALLLVLIGLIITRPLLVLLHTPADVFQNVLDYINIIFMGIPFMFGFFIFQAALQGIGDTVTSLIIQGITVAINTLLDPFFIFGIGIFPAWGVKGAAIATVISRFIASIISFYILFRGKKGLKLKWSNLIPRLEQQKLLIKIGLPASLGQSISALGFTVLQGAVNYFGSSVVAAFGIGNRIIGLFNMPSQGIARATTVLVGQNLGAKNIPQAKQVIKISIIIILLFLVPSMTLTFFYGKYFIQFFIDDQEAIQWGSRLFQLVSFSVVFFGIVTIVFGAFQGAGDTKPVMFLNITRLWALRVPLAYYLAIFSGYGPTGIWVAILLSNIIISLCGFLWLKRGKWIYAINVDNI